VVDADHDLALTQDAFLCGFGKRSLVNGTERKGAQRHGQDCPQRAQSKLHLLLPVYEVLVPTSCHQPLDAAAKPPPDRLLSASSAATAGWRSFQDRPAPTADAARESRRGHP